MKSVAFSYVRFSHPSQAGGDSLRRQTADAAAWCERNGVMLDASVTLHDLGKSAFTGEHRKNADRHALAGFLKLIEAGKVPRGSFLLIENLDRLSREDEVPACHLLTGILMDGVNVVQLSPYEMVLTEKSNGWELMRAVMELSRGHGESAVKSDRLGKAWVEKRRRAREGQEVLTLQLPAWVEESGGKLRLVPERAAVVRKIFELAAGGYGLSKIVGKLIADGVPPMGLGKHWARSYVGLLLRDRRAVGEFQPRLRDGKPDGKPIANYYPPVVSEDEFHAARAGAAQRRNRPGRVGRHVNVFSGLLKNARGNDSYIAVTRTERGKPHRVLVNAAGFAGREKCVSFPLDAFEAAVLGRLRELDVHEILNGDAGPDETQVLAGKLARVETKIAELEAELLDGEVAALARVLRQLEEQKRGIVDRLAQARQKAAHPLSEGWGAAQSLIDVLENAPDPQDARLRLRSALRRIVETVMLLVVPRGRDRLAAVQVCFAGGRTRSYFILSRPPKANASARREGGWWVRSFADVPKSGDFDLRRRADAKRLEKALLAADLDGPD